MKKDVKKTKPMSSLAILKKFYLFLDKKDKNWLILGIIFALFSSISTIVATVITGKIVSDTFEPAIKSSYQQLFNTSLFIKYAATMSVLFICYSIFGYLQSRVFVHVAYKAAKKMRKVAMTKLLYMPTAFYDKEKTGDLISTLVTDINNISGAIVRLLSSLFTNLFAILFTLVAMSFYSSVITLIILVLTILLLSVTFWMTKKARPALIETQNAFGELNGYLEEMLNNTKITQSFDRQPEAQISFNKIAQKIYKNASIGDFYQKIFDPWFFLSTSLITVGAIVIAFLFKINNISTYGFGASVADSGFIIALISLTYNLTGSFQVLLTMFLNLQLGFASSSRVFRLIDLEPPKEPTDTVKLENPQGWIHFDKVWFKYNPNSDSYQLKDASFYAKPGQTVAIVGPTGAGKTTIINLLSKFYYYQDGSITLDGIELNKIDKHDLRDVMAVVLQDSFMFNDTILNNLKIAKPDATFEEIQAVTKLVSADEFILKMKNGYETMIENNGLSLSQGERQLLAIARAILGNKKILILDEATSNVDSNTEKIIQNALQNSVMKNKTSIVIAHRLSTIKNANLILVVESGQIIEKGSHEELMALKGYYWNLYQTQFK
ncbi:ABC transporter ATP-binding protein [Mycoplasmopsis iners]|uniref:ABC transporter ATP-binding protein n=1 Tax=Mycoplasmopsis iners TaxID=76630 RepID=UPI0004955E63|nr:ABC transporter ATP-binding protein [Mycoplasmopsis iners]